MSYMRITVQIASFLPSNRQKHSPRQVSLSVYQVGRIRLVVVLALAATTFLPILWPCFILRFFHSFIFHPCGPRCSSSSSSFPFTSSDPASSLSKLFAQPVSSRVSLLRSFLSASRLPHLLSIHPLALFLFSRPPRSVNTPLLSVPPLLHIASLFNTYATSPRRRWLHVVSIFKSPPLPPLNPVEMKGKFSVKSSKAVKSSVIKPQGWLGCFLPNHLSYSDTFLPSFAASFLLLIYLNRKSCRYEVCQDWYEVRVLVLCAHGCCKSYGTSLLIMWLADSSIDEFIESNNAHPNNIYMYLLIIRWFLSHINSIADVVFFVVVWQIS